MKGTIFDIQRFCTDDGPGIRTVVFLKGCNLRCFWCHNPESQSLLPEIQLFAGQCLGCGRCAAVCPVSAHGLAPGAPRFLRVRCTACGKCARACPAGALVLTGRQAEAEDVLAEIARDKDFYENSGGGVTFSGGEPLLQPGFLKELLAGCRAQGFHTAVESALCVPHNSLAELAPLVDLFLADFKLLDEGGHQAAAGQSNTLILENLRFLAKSGCSIRIRIPVIPGINTASQEVAAMGDFLASLGSVQAVELMPYHAMGSEKYPSLGLSYKGSRLAPPDSGLLQSVKDTLAAKGLNVM